MTINQVWYIDLVDPTITEMELECVRDDPGAYVGANCPMLFATAEAAMEAAGVFWNDERNSYRDEDEQPEPQTTTINWALGQDGNWCGTINEDGYNVLVVVVSPARIWSSLNEHNQARQPGVTAMTPNLAAQVLANKAQELRLDPQIGEAYAPVILARAVTDTLHSPEEFARFLEHVAINLRAEAAELKSAHQDSRSGAIWDRIAYSLDCCAIRNRKLSGHW